MVQPSTPLAPVEGHTATALDGAVYLFGGTNGATTTNDTVRFNVSTGRWKRVIPSTPGNAVPAPRYGHSAVVHNNLVFVYGGYGAGGTPASTEKPVPSSACGLLSSLVVFNPQTGDWNPAHGRGLDACGPCKNHSAVAHRGRMYVFGGCLVQGRTNALRVYDLDAGQWFAPDQLNQQAIAAAASADDATARPTAAKAAEVPAPRSGHSAVLALGGAEGAATTAGMYIFGGRLGKFNFSSDVHRYDLQGKRWQKLYSGGDVPTARCDHSAVVHKGHMVVYGGYTMLGPDGSSGQSGHGSTAAAKTYYSDVHMLNLLSCTWTKVNLLPPPMRGVAAVNGAPSSSSNVPLGSCGHAAVAFQSTEGALCMLTFGGFGKGAAQPLDVGNEDVERTLRAHDGDVTFRTTGDVWLFQLGRVDTNFSSGRQRAAAGEARRPLSARPAAPSQPRSDSRTHQQQQQDSSRRHRRYDEAAPRPESARARIARLAEAAPKAWITQTSRAAVGRTFGVPPDDPNVIPHPPAALPREAVALAVTRLTATAPLVSAKHRQQLEAKYLVHQQRHPMRADEQAEMLDRVFYQRRQEVELKRHELEEKWIPAAKSDKVADHDSIETIVSRLHQPRQPADAPIGMVTVGKRPVSPVTTVRRLYYESAKRQKDTMVELEKKYLWGPAEKKRSPEEIASFVQRLAAASPRK